MSKCKMRLGITTGTCAASAAKAAILAWRDMNLETVNVKTPQGQVLNVKIKESNKTQTGGEACVIKDAGDDPDITNGTEIWAQAVISKKDFLNTSDNRIKISAGKGVGVVTKPGLSVAVGQPAVNPGPRQMIIAAVSEVLPEQYCAEIIISVPDGKRLAKRTLNPILGIEGGISIIGTTGIVRPMSEEAFKESLKPQISVVKALGFDDIIFVPGKIGQDIAVNKYELPSNIIVQTSNFMGYMLESAVSYGMKRVLLFGHLGKIIKVSAGIFHTHSRIADARMEILAANLALLGAKQSVIKEILACTTTEAAITIIEACGLNGVYELLAQKASQRAARYVYGDLVIGTAIVTLKGDMLGLDSNACEIGGSIGWNIL